MNDPDIQAKIADGQISLPTDWHRYKFVIELLIILLVLYILNPHTLTPHLRAIKWKGLLVYVVVIIALFAVFMKFDIPDNGWDVLHFSFYLGLAYFVPKNWVIISILMVSWELYEDHQGFDNDKPKYIETNKKKMVDMVANSLGYYIGNVIFNRQ